MRKFNRSVMLLNITVVQKNIIASNGTVTVVRP